MTVTLRPITVENWLECAYLQPAAGQEEYVASNVFSLAQAAYEPWWLPVGIYADSVSTSSGHGGPDDVGKETMVGFVLFGTWPQTDKPTEYPGGEVGVTYILRFMIGGAYQRRGYGKAGMALALEYIREQLGASSVQLSYEPSNHGAAAFYASFGFRPTGKWHGEEMGVILDLAA